MQQGKMEGDDSQVYFYSVKPKPFKPERLQSAMFCDRPDLWKKPFRKKNKPVSRDQAKLF